MMLKICVVVLNWNRKKDTLECLESIKKVNFNKNEVRLSLVVVDNASRDNSVGELKKVGFDGVEFEIVENSENLGFAAGNNVGIKHAQNHGNDYVILLNNDMLVGENFIEGFINTISYNPKIGLASPKIYFAKGFEYHKERYKKKDLGKVIWYAGGEVDWNNIYGRGRGVNEIENGKYEKIEETDYATGACMLINLKAAKEIGMLDEKYYLYYEDTDFSQRMKRGGWKVFYTPKVNVWHKVSQSSGIGSDLNDYFISRNRMLFGLKYASFRTKIALIKESFKLIWWGRRWQKRGIIDFYLFRYGSGSWEK